ncbi:uncharacterized protein BP01DRAFT_370408 [Aspergillus saccharolyticus JOP 1030-1]|uniref:Alcohol dehydrogenase-like C-terminal domain-containing protein n=1 Tax=Aspergillus saccharolyticus JOP 1030-1 TaxID=1450539 RepID=A0A318ZQ77_9EURO|nr:hypothetical protein BP01DRAFT_370408 [Aspergillus saccharolyticus JOP 1030-1]PYH49759.1 hypothetical protein BP01DRAFT_370408 [Aspergillus saccharolyticus JOP 1030-1]
MQNAHAKWLWSSCQSCPTCKVQYTNCPNQENSGRSVPGTFQCEKYLVSPADFVSPIPETLTPETVAPLLCSGLILYGALNKLDTKCNKGNWVVPHHGCIQIGREMGYRIIASGAEAFIDLQDDPTIKIQALTDSIGAHAVIVVVGLEKAYEQSVTFLRPVGTLVCMGLPQPDYHLPISPLVCVDRGYRMVGSAVDTEAEMQALLGLAAEWKVVTHMRMIEPAEVNEVAGPLRRFAVEGRAVLRIPV